MPTAASCRQLEGESDVTRGTRTLVLTRAGEQLTFVGLDAEPVPSILRGFSAPVILDFDYTDAQLLTLLANDPDPFNRWEAGQRLAPARRAAGHCRPGHRHRPGAERRLHRRHAQRAAQPAARRRLQGTGAHAAVGNLHRRAARRGRPAARAPGARSHARPAGHRPVRRLGAGVRRTKDTGAYSPTRLVGPPRAGRHGAHLFLCLAARASGDTVWPGKTPAALQGRGQHDRPLQRAGALVSSGHTLAAQALRASTPSSRTRRWSSTSGSRCRPARPTAAATSCRW
jgi:aminopeptidase N